MVSAVGLALLRMAVLPSEIPAEKQALVQKTGRAGAYHLAERGADAEQAYAELVAAYPDEPWVHYAQGVLLLRTDSERGIAALRRELQVNPGNVLACLDIAFELLKLRRNEEAKDVAERAVELAPRCSRRTPRSAARSSSSASSTRGIRELEAGRTPGAGERGGPLLAGAGLRASRPRGGRGPRAGRVHAPRAGARAGRGTAPAAPERCGPERRPRLLPLSRLAAAPARPCPPDGTDEPRVRFTDVTEAAGLNWGIRKVAVQGANLVETMGGGGGFVDFDGDGWLDVYLVSYSPEPQPGTGKPVGDALFRNNHDGTFTDVTGQAGIAGVQRGMGLAVADYDGDGRPDLFVSGYDTSALYHNEGGGRFRDVTDRAGVREPAVGLQRHVPRLRPRRPARPLRLELPRLRPGQGGSATPAACTTATRSARSRGSRGSRARSTATGATARSRTRAPRRASRASSARAWPSSPRTSTTTAGWTCSRRTTRRRTSSSGTTGDGRFREVALEAEVAFDPSGRVTGAMGTDAEDVDGDGRLDLLVTNFNHYGTFLHANTGGMRFVDRGSALGLSMPTFNTSVFGARFLDVDDDGSWISSWPPATRSLPSRRSGRA